MLQVTSRIFADIPSSILNIERHGIYIHARLICRQRVNGFDCARLMMEIQAAKHQSDNVLTAEVLYEADR